ncbi:hypothetical protein GCK72_020090 [Caenorhabditis remanei]|uniref:Uncharacterized protein n=1 Tax=Caenorhabditis remanei TaxID=31234 RepID=A0A6A5GFT8_CAERE|nr:hypothetical protein GCK72_020090 [Caenorhabditis remanei]KAF1753533.1 hypothetical protein GCK72_020090 [Caenorhabditis remanei]
MFPAQSPKFELLCAAMLGAGQLFMNTAFDAEAFILESVIHSVHERDPERIDQYAGYYGQSVIYGSFMISCLFTPSLLNVWTPKTLLVISSFCFAAFPFGFQFGMHHLSDISLNEKINRIERFITMGDWVWKFDSRIDDTGNNDMVQWGCSKRDIDECDGGGAQIGYKRIHRLLSLVLIVVSILAVIIVCFLPSKDVENCIESSVKNGSFKKDLKLTFTTSISLKMLQIVPLCMLCGFNASFLMSIIPTSMHFNKNNAKMLYIPAIYSLGAGTGEVLMGFIIAESSRRIKGFGLKPTMVIGTVTLSIYCVLIHASTPFEAPMKPTSEEPMLFYQSYPLIYLIALICGISDCCFNGVRSVICALVMPSRRAQSFSVSRMYQAAACVIIFFFSPIIPLYVYTCGLPVLAVFSTFVFFKIVDSTNRMERKLTSQTWLEQDQKSTVEK